MGGGERAVEGLLGVERARIEGLLGVERARMEKAEKALAAVKRECLLRRRVLPLMKIVTNEIFRSRPCNNIS